MIRFPAERFGNSLGNRLIPALLFRDPSTSIHIEAWLGKPPLCQTWCKCTCDGLENCRVEALFEAGARRFLPVL